MSVLKADMHVHSRLSSDGLAWPEDLVAHAKAIGLGAIALTDHDRSCGYDRLVELGLADRSGQPVDGFLVIPGVEVSTRQGHVLVLGAAMSTPAKRGGVEAKDLIARAHDVGALAVAAHPCDRSRSGVGPAAVRALGFDAVEGWNSKTIVRSANFAATRLGRSLGLPLIAGSDAHAVETLARAYTELEVSTFNVAGVLEAIKLRRTKIVRGQHTAADLARYWTRGWLTRPWLAEVTKRTIVTMSGRRSA